MGSELSDTSLYHQPIETDVTKTFFKPTII